MKIFKEWCEALLALYILFPLICLGVAVIATLGGMHDDPQFDQPPPRILTDLGDWLWNNVFTTTWYIVIYVLGLIYTFLADKARTAAGSKLP